MCSVNIWLMRHKKICLKETNTVPKSLEDCITTFRIVWLHPAFPDCSSPHFDPLFYFLLILALARWLTGLECPIHQKVAGSIPSQSTYLGCGFNPQLGAVQEETSRCFSLFLPPPPSLSLKSVNISLGEDLKF